MARGRQYYDPIVQVPSSIGQADDLSRIEMFPAGPESEARLPQDIGKWIGRRINPDGSIAEEAPGDFDYERALKQAQSLWPELTVYEMASEHADSTWSGVGPSPRLWQVAGSTPTEIPPAVESPPAPQPTEEQAPLRMLVAPEPGPYVLLSDILYLLEMWAVSYEVDKNPSGALALRDAVDALKDVR